MTIDTRPLPSAATAATLVRSWLRPPASLAQWGFTGDTPLWLSRSSWGMAALAAVVAARAGRPARIAFPDYFCDQALWPLRQEAVALSFYPVDERGRPDWAAVEAMPPADIFYLVHFYGHRSDAARARAFCDAHGAVLVEDATHAVGPDDTIGCWGDVTFYSPWKFFAIPNGAVMVVAARAAALVEPVTRAVALYGTGVSRGLNWVKTSALAQLPGRAAREGLAACAPGDFFADAPTQPMARRPRAAAFARPMLASVRLDEVAARRRANDAAVRGFFAALPGWQPFDASPANGPLRSAFRANSPNVPTPRISRCAG